jgi:hypothetical protein
MPSADAAEAALSKFNSPDILLPPEIEEVLGFFFLGAI